MSFARRRGAGRVLVLALILLVAIAGGAVVITVGPETGAAAPGLLGALAVLVRPILGLVAITFPLPFEDALLIGGAATITKVMGAGVAGLWAGHKILRGESWSDVLSSPLVVLAVLFVAFAASSYLWAEYPGPVIGGIFRLVMLMALAVLVIDIVESWTHVAWLFRALVLGGIIAGALVISQYFGLGASRAGDQVAGGINATALVLVTLLPFGFYLIRSGRGFLWRLAGLTYVAIALVAVAVTFSRMSFLLVPFILLLEAWETFRKRRGRVGIAVLAAIAVVVAVRFIPMQEVRERVETIGPYIEATLSGRTPENPYLSGRGYHLYVAYRIFQDHPVVGVGYENYGRHFLRYQLRVPGSAKLYESARSPHSSFAGVLSELGLVGLALWLTVLGASSYALLDAWRNTRGDRSSEAYFAVRAVIITFILLLAYGFYAEMQYEKIFWLVLGLSFAVRSLAMSGSTAQAGDSDDYDPRLRSTARDDRTGQRVAAGPRTRQSALR